MSNGRGASAIHGLIFGGAFAATIAQWIIAPYAQSWLIGVYMVVLLLISLAAVSTVKDPMGVDLNIKEVHDEYLRAHPDAISHDHGIAVDMAR